MTPSQQELQQYLDAARRGWRARVLVRGLLGGFAVAGLLAGALALLALTGAAPWIAASGPGAGIARLAPWLPAAGVLAVLLPAMHRGLLRAPDDRALALRAEEVEPGLGHLPSLLLELPPEHPYAAELFREGEARLRGRDPGRPAGPWGRAGEVATLAAVVTVGVTAVMGAGGPLAVRAAWTPPASTLGPSGSEVGFAGDESAAAHALSRLSLRVTPPAYTGLDAFDLQVEEGVRALAGSRVELHGAIPASVKGAAMPQVSLLEEGSSHPLEVTSSDGGWSVDRILAEGDRGLLLTATAGDAVRERVIPLEILLDAPPTVTLLEPERDLVLATGTGEVTFRALADDPHGIDSFWLSWVHTRGSGESFDFREGAVDWSQVERTGSELEGTVTLRLEELGLGPGDVLHLRAQATDGNEVTGPGTGVSGTRQIRVIREGDEMLVDALIGFPVEAEQDPVLSQRMILLLTEDLLARAPTLTRKAFQREAVGLADEQARLRIEVGEQVFSRATGAMEPITDYLGGGEHSHGDELGGADGHALDVHADDEAGTTAAQGSTYGVAAIFDPSVAEREREHEQEAQAALARATTFQDEAGTQVGNYSLGDVTRMPTGFGIVDDLGHQHDGDPILSVNEPLLSIYNHMWESERYLRLAELDASVPYQEDALAELQELRDGNRVFARGRVIAPPVDVVEVRGTGEVDDAAPTPRDPGTPLPGPDRWVAELERVLAEPGPDPAGALTRLAVGLLGDRTADSEVGSLVARAAGHAQDGEADQSRELLLEALGRLDPSPSRTASAPTFRAPSSPLAAWTPRGDGPAPDGSDVTEPRPFVFATLRYESGNWDSAPLVPQNLIHSLAQYTELPVEPEGVVVDLSSRDIFAYPVLYLTGHLPVRFSDTEARNLMDYVERGGFVLMDDHNHDLDGAFHRTATAELARIFGEDALAPLPNDHELYRAFFHFEDGPPSTSHEFSGWGDGLVHPELHAVMVDGRIGILYSNKDYSSEWSYHAVNKRFLAVDNTRFGVNVLLYALTR